MKKILFLLMICISALLSKLVIANAPNEIKDILPEKPFLDTNLYTQPQPNNVKLNTSGTVFTVNTLESDATWHKFAEFTRGMFEPNKYYTVEFRYKLSESIENEGRIFFIVRDTLAAANGEIKDLGSYSTTSINNKYKTVSFSFRAPEKSTDYAFVIHGLKKLKASVRNLRIYEGFSRNMISPTPDAKPSEIKLENEPSGCPDFIVELPDFPPEAPSLNASDFGVSPNASGQDNFINFQKAIDECKSKGIPRLILNKGTYHFENLNDSKPIEFSDMSNFEFDGKDSLLIFNKNSGSCFSFRRNNQIKFSNVSIDWDWEKDPLASIVEIVNVGSKEGVPFWDIKFLDYKKFPNKQTRTALINAYDKNTKQLLSAFGCAMALSANKESDMKKEWISDNVLRIICPRLTHKPAIGSIYRLQHYYYDKNGFDIFDNSHMTFENVNLYSVAGHAFLIGGYQRFWQFLNTNIKLRPDVNRPLITCTADHLHFSRSCGNFKMIGCEFSYGIDDCINFHDCSGFARKQSKFSILTQNADGFYKGAKVELRQSDYSPTGFIGTVKMSNLINAQKRISEVIFEEEVPEQIGNGFIMFNKAFNTHNLLVKDCYFHDNRCRGILLLGSDATIENCRFERHQMGGIKIETGYTFNVWSEGYGVSNVIVRNNVFDHVNIADHKHGGYSRDIYFGVYMETDPSDVGTLYPILNNIVFEGNKFVETSGLIAYVSSTGNVTFRDNTFINNEPSKNGFPYRSAFYVCYSSDTKILNNKWIKSEHAPFPGVFFDKETTKNLIFEGNKIIEKTIENTK